MFLEVGILVYISLVFLSLCFPLSLNLHYEYLSTKGYNWPCCETVRILELRTFVSDRIFIDNRWPNLEKLTLRMYHFSRYSTHCTGKGWNHIPKLKVFKFSGLENFGDEFFQNENNVRNLKEISIGYYPDPEDDEQLEGYGQVFGLGWHEKFYTNIEKIVFRDLGDVISDKFFQRFDFPALRSLGLWGMQTLTGVGWKSMKSLKKLITEKCTSISFEEKELLKRVNSDS